MKKTSSLLKIIIILVISILPPYFNNSLFAQLSGTKNIPGNYATIRDAINDINAVGVNGPVVFLLANGAHAISNTGTTQALSAWIGASVSPGGVTGSSAINTITFKPAVGATVTISISTTAANQHGIRLNGADYIIFDGSNSGGTSRDMTIQMISNYTSRVFDICDPGVGGGSTNNIIKNCNIIGYSNVASNYGIYVRNSAGAGDDENFNNTFENNQIYQTYYGIWFSGVSGGADCTGNKVKNNIIGSSGASSSYIACKGIYAQYQTNMEISGNEIFNIIANVTIIMAGIEIDNSINVTISKNKIHDIGYTGTLGYGGKAIYLNTRAANPGITISNNFIYSIFGDGDAGVISSTPTAIYVGWTTTAPSTVGGVSICFNSIYLSPNATYGLNYNANVKATGVYVQVTTSGIIMCSNIFRTSLGEKTGCGFVSNGYAVYSDAIASPFNTIDYNIYYITGQDNNYVGYGNGSARATLANWQAYTGQDASSKNQDPTFVSTTDLHVTSFVSGANCASITTDIDGQTRPATPSIGADEDVVTPIELLSFTASCNDNNIVLNWSTASEINNNYFTIERSTEQNLQDLKWEVIATANGAGNSNQIINYNYTDFPNIALQNIYYRLKQTDYDGSFKYYDIITTSCSKECSFSLNKIYPNPSTDLVYISYSTNEDQIIKLSVFDLLGHEIISENLISNKGENINQINLNNLQNGLYWIVINSKDMVHSYKINLIN